MSGCEGPSDAELVKRMEKRLNQARYDKRYNRNGMKIPAISNEDVGTQSSDRLEPAGSENQNNTSDG